MLKDFEPGQIWSVTSEVPTTTKVIIGRVENLGAKTAIHVSLIDIPIPAHVQGAGGVTDVGHIPFEQSALASSVDELLGIGEVPLPDFEGGYAQWKADKGGIFTISIAEAETLIFGKP